MTAPIERIAAVEPFASMTPAQRARLAEVCRLRTAAAGDRLYRAGEQAHALLILVSGTVRLEEPAAAAMGERPTVVDAPGALLSKGSLLRSFEHRHDLVAAGDAELLELERDAFYVLVGEPDGPAPALLDHLVRAITSEIRELNEAIQSLMRDG